MDMGINEFDEVGEVVRQFASDDAIVVVGTVIDPEMSDEIRVTLVATGLEEEQEIELAKTLNAQTDARQVKSGPRSHLKPVVLEPVQKTAVGAENVVVNNERTYGNSKPQYDSLDIPAFLRNQAD
jgi:cell division protein FtsZ